MLVLNKAEVESLLDLDELVDAVAAAMADLSAGNASMPNRIAALVPGARRLPGRDARLPAIEPRAHDQAGLRLPAEPRPPDAPGRGGVLRPRHRHADRVDGRRVDHRGAHRSGVRAVDEAARSGGRARARDPRYGGAGARPCPSGGAGPCRRARRDRGARSREGRGRGDRAGAGARASGRRRGLVRGGRARRRRRVYHHACHGAGGAPRVGVAGDAHLLGGVQRGGPRGDRSRDGRRCRRRGRAPRLRARPASVRRGELLLPIADGLFDASHIRAELGELVSGTATGRTSPQEITLYKSVGVAVQDAAAASMVLAAARARGIGTDIAI